LLPPIIVLATLILLWARTLFSPPDYIGYTNFITPSSPSLITQFYWTWSPYQYGGFPTLSPLSLALQYIFDFGPLKALGVLFGSSAAVRLYILATPLFLGLSFYLLVGEFTRDRRLKIIGVLFLLLNPFQFELYANGDFYLFVPQAFLFLSLALLCRSFNGVKRRPLILLVSLALLTFCAIQFQVYLLGIVFFLTVGVLVILIPKRQPWLQSARSILIHVASTLLVIPLSLVFLLPLIAGPSAPVRDSVYAVTVQTFVFYSSGTTPVLFLHAYPPNSGWTLAGFAGPVIEFVWTGMMFAVLLFILGSYFIARDRRLLLLSAALLAFALIGAGPSGFLGTFADYLYLHSAFFQVVNASYYWDWLLIAPLYGLGLVVALAQLEGVTVERVRQRVGALLLPLADVLSPPPHVPDSGGITPSPPDAIRPVGGRRSRFRVFRARTGSTKSFTIRVPTVQTLVIAFVLVTLAIPAAAQGYVQPANELRGITLPYNFAAIAADIKDLAGTNETGVAFFNPDANLYTSNISNMFPNTDFYFPTFRVAGLPFYQSPPLLSNFYFLWVYHLFYTNATKYVAELMGLAGIQYFVVLYGSNSASYYPWFMSWADGKNASTLLTYQVGVKEVLDSSTFAIYDNTYYSGPAKPISNFTILAGGYDLLNSAAYTGVNISNLAVMFPEDLPQGSCGSIVNQTGLVVSSSQNALYGIALRCLSVTPLDLMAGANPLNDPSDGWTSNFRLLGLPVLSAEPGQFPVTSGPYSLSVSGTDDCTGSCDLWLHVLSSPQSGDLTLSVGSNRVALQTNPELDGLANSFVWVKVPLADYSRDEPVTMTSLDGTNAVDYAYIVENMSVEREMTALQSQLASRDSKLLSVAGAYEIGLDSAELSDSLHYQRGDALTAPGNQSGAVPSSQMLILSAGSSATPVTAHINLSTFGTAGSVLLRLQGLGRFVATLTVSNETANLILDSGNYASYNESWGWVRLNVPASPELSLNITLDQGVMYIALVAFASNGTLPALSGQEVPVGNITYVGVSPGVTAGSPIVSESPQLTEISGSLNVTSPANLSAGGVLVNAIFQNETEALPVTFSCTASSGIELFIDGEGCVGNTSSVPISVSPNLRYNVTSGYWSKWAVDVSAAPGTILPLGSYNYSLRFNTSSAGSVFCPTPDDDLGAQTIELTNLVNGYVLSNVPTTHYLLVRLSFFSSLIPSQAGVSTASLSGGLNTLIVLSSNDSGSLQFVVASSNAASLGLLVGLLTAGIYVAAAVVLKRRSRNVIRREPVHDES